MAILVSALIISVPAMAGTDPFSEACKVPGASGADACTKTPTPITGANGIFMKITNFVAVIAGTAAVIIIIIAGIQFLLSGGDSNKVAGARSAIIFAIAGIVIIVVARSVIALVVTRLAN